jgi:hypothetical protein
MGKDATLHMRIPADLKAELAAAAKLDDRSVASLVQKLIRDHCAKVSAAKQSQGDEPK